MKICSIRGSINQVSYTLSWRYECIRWLVQFWWTLCTLQMCPRNQAVQHFICSTCCQQIAWFADTCANITWIFCANRIWVKYSSNTVWMAQKIFPTQCHRVCQLQNILMIVLRCVAGWLQLFIESCHHFSKISNETNLRGKIYTYFESSPIVKSNKKITSN